MMPNENPQPNPGTGPASEGANPEGGKLIAGKFKTLEEAVEKGYVGLEKAFHEQGEKISALTRVLEAALTADPNPGAPPVERDRGGYNDPYNRDRPQPDKINPADFIADPGKILDEREAKLLVKVGGVVTDVVANAFAVNEFKRLNPDLVKHEKLVKVYMGDTDPRKSVSERLEDAGKKVREYIAILRGEKAPAGRPPTGEDYVEGPRGPTDYVPVLPGSDANAEKADADELAAYISERNADLSAHFGGNRTKE